MVSGLTMACISRNRSSLWWKQSDVSSSFGGSQYTCSMFVLSKFMLSCSKVQSMTTRVIFLDCVSGNYWSNMCDCDGENMKGRRHREREAGFLAASLSHWITPHPKSSGRCCTIRPFQVEPILSFIFQVRTSLVPVPCSWNCPDTDLVLPTAPTLKHS